MAKITAGINLDKAEKVLREAILRGLSTRALKDSVEKLAAAEIEKVVTRNQDLFRPDKGSDGGDDLVGFLGIGQGGEPSTSKYAGNNAAWTLLRPGTDAAKITSSFRKATAGNFGNISYTINLDRFFNNFRSTYLSRKRGDSDLVISWMQGLIDGVATEQTRESADAGARFAFVTNGPAFNPSSSRTGLGHMINIDKIKIPVQQFSFNGRGRANTFGVLIDKIRKSVASNAFKNKISKSIKDSILRSQYAKVKT